MKRLSFQGLRSASGKASVAARGSSKKTGTRCELLLRQALWAKGCRYRKNVKDLPGCPDIVFLGARVAIFCDGEFWHGREWEARRQKLGRGHNPAYWLGKIQRNIERDWQNTQELLERGWTVLHVWESEIRSDPERVAREVLAILRGKASSIPTGS
jgi:DNA mismatch endonuclease, patch repair protein